MTWISGEAAQMWHNAVSPDKRVLKRALGYWARNRDTLPGPLFFTVPQTELTRGEWQRVVNASHPQCACGERRWFAPTQSLEYYPYDNPKLVVLEEGQRQLALGPWGGDTQATLMQLSVTGGMLHIRLLPYSGFSQAVLNAVGFGVQQITEEVVGRIYTSPDERPQDYTPLAHIARQMNGMTEPATVRTLIRAGKAGENDWIACRMFGIHAVDTEQKTLTVAAGRNCKVMNPADRSEFHTCAA